MSTIPHNKKSSPFVVWRESASAGDDIDAPHEIKLPAKENESVSSAVARVVSANYLPQIAGGKATWILEAASQQLAVLAQQWPEPRYLVPKDQPIVQFIGNSGRCHMYFKYWCQADPDVVFECLKNGKPLPDKYS